MKPMKPVNHTYLDLIIAQTGPLSTSELSHIQVQFHNSVRAAVAANWVLTRRRWAEEDETR